MTEISKLLIIITVVIAVSYAVALNHSTAGNSTALLSLNSLGANDSVSLQSASLANVEHHSMPTMMSLQGKVEGVSDGDLGVKISDENSCSSGVFFDYNYTGAIQNGLFNILLGSTYTLSLNYNQDYYMCLYVNGELVGGPNQFRGGQGQIAEEDVNFSALSISNDVNVGGTLRVTGSLYTSSENIEINIGGSGSRNAYIDFHSADTPTDYSARIIRWSGTDSDLQLVNTGSGAIQLRSAGKINFQVNGDNDDYIEFTTLGNVPQITTAGTCDLKFDISGTVEIETGPQIGSKASLTLDQDDADNPFIKFEGTQGSYGGANIFTDTGVTARKAILVNVNGTEYTILVRDPPPVDASESRAAGGAADITIDEANIIVHKHIIGGVVYDYAAIVPIVYSNMDEEAKKRLGFSDLAGSEFTENFIVRFKPDEWDARTAKQEILDKAGERVAYKQQFLQELVVETLDIDNLGGS